MKILATFPGRHGDIIWALPTVRAIAEGIGEPVSLALSPKYSSLQTLIGQQEYVREVLVWDGWEVQETAPMTPWEAPIFHADLQEYNHICHLGYRGWPNRPLPYCTYSTVQREYPEIPLALLDLDRPWIILPLWDLRGKLRSQARYVVAWSDEWIELKMGLFLSLLGTGGRLIDTATRTWEWEQILNAAYDRGGLSGPSWEEAAGLISEVPLFLGCCSALHVLACALGKRCLIVEPSTMRHHPIFYPYGMDGPKVTVVRGEDGQPTFDARATRAALEKLLQEVS